LKNRQIPKRYKIAATCNKICNKSQRMLSRNVDTCCLMHSLIYDLCVLTFSINMRRNQILLQVAAILLLV
jgi:hypothetical protein